MRKIVVIFLALILCACSSGKSKFVKSTDFGDKWPLTVTEGTIRVVNHFEVVFESNGQTYAVNGNAQKGVREGKYRDIFEIVAVDSTRLKWLQNADCPVNPKEVPMDISPILDIGVAMMDE